MLEGYACRYTIVSCWISKTKPQLNSSETRELSFFSKCLKKIIYYNIGTTYRVQHCDFCVFCCGCLSWIKRTVVVGRTCKYRQWSTGRYLIDKYLNSPLHRDATVIDSIAIDWKYACIVSTKKRKKEWEREWERERGEREREEREEDLKNKRF